MNRGNLIVILVLATLALVPVSLFLLCSGDGEDDLPETKATVSATPPSGKAPSAGRTVSGTSGVPVFEGFEDARYQKFDAFIAKFVDDFNRNREKWIGGTAAQGQRVPELTAAQVKAHMIQETGGGDMRSRSAWAKDPLQVNVPGDWNPYKKYLGLREPRRRNEGSLEKNLKAGIMLLARKGFGVSGQPAGNRPEGGFDGWKPALQRYNGRSDKAADGRPYRDAYAERILKRASNPARETPIPIPTRKR